MLNAIKGNPFHSVIGMVEVCIGIYLIVHDNYFRWPPFVAGMANDDIVGASFVLLGIAMLFWVFDKRRSLRMDHFVLICSAGFLTALTIYQFLHVIVLGIDMPWISNAALTSVVMILAWRSDSE